MPIQSAYHSLSGRPDFLGLRTGPGGATEIVYDDGRRRRLVWRVRGGARMPDLDDALRVAVNESRVIPALYTELKKRGVAIEAVAR